MRALLPTLALLPLLAACAGTPERTGATPPAPTPGACTAVDVAALEAAFAAGHATFTAGDWRTEPAEADGAPGVDHGRAPRFAPLLRQLGLDEAADLVDLAHATNAFEVYDCTMKRQDASLEAGTRDVVLTIDCANEGLPFTEAGEAVDALVIARTTPGGACLVHASFERGYVADRPCLTDVPEGVNRRAITPIELVAPGRHALRKDRYGGHCDGVMRGDFVTTSFLGLEGGVLVEYFSGIVSKQDYDSPCPPTRGVTGRVTLGPSFPKTITYAVEHFCEEAMEGCTPDPDCKRAAGSDMWTYSDGRYTRDGAPGLDRIQE